MSTMASQITSLTIVYSTVHSGADQIKHQSSASLAFVWGIDRPPVNSPHKGPVTRKMFPFDDVIMWDIVHAYLFRFRPWCDFEGIRHRSGWSPHNWPSVQVPGTSPRFHPTGQRGPCHAEHGTQYNSVSTRNLETHRNTYYLHSCQFTLDYREPHWLSMGLPEISTVTLTGMDSMKTSNTICM